jgi:hypothetical protein
VIKRSKEYLQRVSGIFRGTYLRILKYSDLLLYMNDYSRYEYLENINLKEIFVCGVDLKTKNAFVA